MKSLHTQIEIAAPPDRVWKILTNFAAYQEWNPFIRNAVCPIFKVGERMEIALLPPGGEGWTFAPTLMVVHPERELRWLGRFIFPGVFDGEHCFTIESLDNHRVRLVQSENFRGLLVPFFGQMLEKTRAGFEEMNHALKMRAESSLVL
jgi:hypothetical protein